MASNTLQAVITADIKDLKAKLAQADKLIDQYANNISKIKNAISKNTTISQGYEKQLQDLNNQLQKGAISQEQYAKESADVTQSLLRTQQETRDYQKELRRLQNELNRVQKASTNMGTTTQRTAKSTENLASASNKTGKTVGNATSVMTSFSQVVQDAPYGIRGVANNIQQLTAQFSYLQKSAGGTRLALKALLGSLTGPAGILLAVSAITSLMVTFSGSMGTAANEAEKLSDKIDDLNDSFDSELAINDEIKKSLELQGLGVSRVLELRKDILKNQLEGLGVLIQQQKVLLENQQIQNETVTTWEHIVGWMTQAWAVIKGVASIAFNMAKTLGTAVVDFVESVSFDFIKKEANELINIFKENSKARSASQKDIQKEQALQTKLNNLTAKYLGILNQIAEIDRGTGKDLLLKANVQIDGLDSAGLEGLDGSGFAIPEIPIPKIPDQELISKLGKIIEASKIMGNAVAYSFRGMASAISESLSTGNSAVDAFVGSIINSLTEMLSAMAANLVKKIAMDKASATSSVIAGGAAAGAATGPAAFVTTPIFIAALTGLITAAFAGITSSFAHGGIVSGGSYTGDKVPAMVNSGEMILNQGQQGRLFNILNGNLSSLQNNNQGVIVSGRIEAEGTKLVTVISNTQSRNKRLGGSRKL